MEDFIKYLESKNLSKSTQKAYLRHVNLFKKWFENDAINCTKKDILKYLEHLKNSLNQENTTRNIALIALNHYFAFLAKNGDISSNPTALLKIRGTNKKMLYNILSNQELEQLLDNFYHSYIRNFDDTKIPKNQRRQSFLSRQRNYVMLGLLIYQGLATNELQKINLDDIDLNKATVKIKPSRKSNERKITLKAPQIGAFINYINTIRPQFFDFCSETDKLFFALPESGKLKTSSENLMHTFKPLTKQVKTLDKNFLNFKQIRASVITNWLKTEGLRKTQYLAGHRYISSTEKYLPNDLEGLIDDIAKFNPF